MFIWFAGRQYMYIGCFSGVILVVFSFPFLYMVCLTCEQFSERSVWIQFGYYSIFIAMFQIGWAASQISHLAMVPELTSNQHVKVELNAIR